MTNAETKLEAPARTDAGMAQQYRELLGEEQYKRLRSRVQEDLSHISAWGVRMQNERLALTGYACGEFFDWDLYFENIFMSYFGVSVFCRNGVEMFLSTQAPAGFIQRTLGTVYPRPRHHFKPFLAQIALLGCRQTGNYGWLDGSVYEKLAKYLDYWLWFCDLDKNGLCSWNSAGHSGMDNQFRRAGALDTMTVEGVDLNCYLARDFDALAILAERIGKEADARVYRARAARLAELVNETLWDEQDGFYYDRDERTAEPVRVKSVSSFAALWAGVATPERGRRMIEAHLLNPDEFWLPYPVASWARTEPDFYQEPVGAECNWRGTAWIPTNYMVFHGLMRYGFAQQAGELADKTLRMALNEEATREYYNSQTGAGLGRNPFFGWSTLAYFMPLEWQLRYDPTGLEQMRILPLGRESLALGFDPLAGPLDLASA